MQGQHFREGGEWTSVRRVGGQAEIEPVAAGETEDLAIYCPCVFAGVEMLRGVVSVIRSQVITSPDQTI